MFIEDAYTGTVVAVDNVPLGPAVVGSVMSNMGYRTTRLFEQAFAMPSMTGHGFADSLQTLTAVRKNLLSRVGLGAANVPNVGSDMETSFVNYVRECTLTGVDLNLKSVDAILRDADPLNAIRFDSDIYMTEIYVGGQPQTKTCTDAWTDLGVVANGAFSTALENLLQQTLGVQAAADTVPKIQDAFDALAGQGVINAADYILNLFINMSAAGKMAALTSANYNLPSMMGIYQLDMELQQWLSIGGYVGRVDTSHHLDADLSRRSYRQAFSGTDGRRRLCQ